MFKDKYFIILLVALMCIVLMLANTTPESVGPSGVAIFFVLVFIASFFTTAIIMRRAQKGTIYSLGHGQTFVITSVIAAVPPTLLALQSLGQLVVRDVLLMSILCGLAVFYSIKRG